MVGAWTTGVDEGDGVGLTSGVLAGGGGGGGGAVVDVASVVWGWLGVSKNWPGGTTGASSEGFASSGLGSGAEVGSGSGVFSGSTVSVVVSST